jgi:hypothetical protein
LANSLKTNFVKFCNLPEILYFLTKFCNLP